MNKQNNILEKGGTGLTIKNNSTSRQAQKNCTANDWFKNISSNDVHDVSLPSVRFIWQYCGFPRKVMSFPVMSAFHMIVKF